MAEESKLLKSCEVADLLQVPARTLDEWAYRKTGPAYLRVGRYRRYRAADVARWLDGHRVENGGAA